MMATEAAANGQSSRNVDYNDFFSEIQDIEAKTGREDPEPDPEDLSKTPDGSGTFSVFEK